MEMIAILLFGISVLMLWLIINIKKNNEDMIEYRENVVKEILKDIVYELDSIGYLIRDIKEDRASIEELRYTINDLRKNMVDIDIKDKDLLYKLDLEKVEQLNLEDIESVIGDNAFKHIKNLIKLLESIDMCKKVGE